MDRAKFLHSQTHTASVEQTSSESEEATLSEEPENANGLENSIQPGAYHVYNTDEDLSSNLVQNNPPASNAQENVNRDEMNNRDIPVANIVHGDRFDIATMREDEIIIGVIIDRKIKRKVDIWWIFYAIFTLATVSGLLILIMEKRSNVDAKRDVF